MWSSWWGSVTTTGEQGPANVTPLDHWPDPGPCSSPVRVKGACGLLRSKPCKAVVLHQELPVVSCRAQHSQDRPWGAAGSGPGGGPEGLPPASRHPNDKTSQLSSAGEFSLRTQDWASASWSQVPSGRGGKN